METSGNDKSALAETMIKAKKLYLDVLIVIWFEIKKKIKSVKYSDIFSEVFCHSILNFCYKTLLINVFSLFRIIIFIDNNSL